MFTNESLSTPVTIAVNQRQSIDSYSICRKFKLLSKRPKSSVCTTFLHKKRWMFAIEHPSFTFKPATDRAVRKSQPWLAVSAAFRFNAASPSADTFPTKPSEYRRSYPPHPPTPEQYNHSHRGVRPRPP